MFRSNNGIFGKDDTSEWRSLELDSEDTPWLLPPSVILGRWTEIREHVQLLSEVGSEIVVAKEGLGRVCFE